MGQKVHPYGFRLGTLYGWQSNWFAERNYGPALHEDIRIREFIKKKLYHAGISRVVIERTGEKLVVNIHTARPGILIGNRGAEVESLTTQEIRKRCDAVRAVPMPPFESIMWGSFDAPASRRRCDSA